jgi:hypothetical protein
VAGTRVAGSEFDIANVVLQSPPTGSTQRLPVTFYWQTRSVVSDGYMYELYDPADANADWFSGNLGHIGAFTLWALPPGAAFGKRYAWTVWVGDGADGLGVSCYYGYVTFSSSVASAPPDGEGGISLLAPSQPTWREGRLRGDARPRLP